MTSAGEMAESDRQVESGDGHTHERNCLNCGCALTGDFCHCCGQRAHVHRTIGAFFHDLAHGVLHFEGKIWRTLPLLVWRPGDLTRRYIEGQRASFVSPIALFLFSVFLMFAVVSASGNLNPNLESGIKQLEASENALQTELRVLQERRAETAAAKQPTAKLDEDIADKQAELKLVRDLRGKGVTQATYGPAEQTFSTKLEWVEQAYHKARRNPDLLFYKMKSNAYKWSWAVIPLSAPFLWLLFPFNRRFRMYDHVVFVTYSLSFMTMLTIVAIGLSSLGASDVGAMFFVVPPLHMYRQLRGAYGVGRWGALWRTLFLSIAAVLVLTAFALLMAALGLMD